MTEESAATTGGWRWAVAVAFVLGLIVLGLARGARRGARPPKAVKMRQVLMGTFVNMTVTATDREAALAAMRGAVKRMRRVDALMSTYREDSEVSVANRVADARATAISPDTAHVLREALRFGELTGGAFDITVGPLIGLWRRCVKADRLPADEELKAARERVGFRDVRLSQDGSTVRFGRPGMSIALGGIAKGYAVDVAYRALAEAGFPNALVGIGGDIFVGGVRPDGGPWKVGVQDPRASRDSPPSVLVKLRLSDRAVATSGNYRRYSEVRGKRISHILDPRTGGPADAVPSVTIVASDCATADALATGVSVLGVEAGLKLVESMAGAEALLITVEGGQLKFHRSRGMGALEIKPPSRASAPIGSP